MEFAIIVLLIGWILYKVFKWIFIFLGIVLVGSTAKVNSTPKKRQKPVVKSEEPVVEYNMSTIENSEPVVEEKEPELKYKNAVYISFRRKVYKAFESYKRAGDKKVTWNSEKDGFSIIYGGERLLGSERYEVIVCHDKDNLLGLADPYYITISYTFAFKKDEFNRYKDLAEYINNYYNNHQLFDKELLISHVVNAGDTTPIGIYTCGIIITDNKYLYGLTKKYGEAVVFGSFLKKAGDEYTEGLERYKSEHGKSII